MRLFLPVFFWPQSQSATGNVGLPENSSPETETISIFWRDILHPCRSHVAEESLTLPYVFPMSSNRPLYLYSPWLALCCGSLSCYTIHSDDVLPSPGYLLLSIPSICAAPFCATGLNRYHNRSTPMLNGCLPRSFFFFIKKLCANPIFTQTCCQWVWPKTCCFISPHHRLFCGQWTPLDLRDFSELWLINSQ